MLDFVDVDVADVVDVVDVVGYSIVERSEGSPWNVPRYRRFRSPFFEHGGAIDRDTIFRSIRFWSNTRSVSVAVILKWTEHGEEHKIQCEIRQGWNDSYISLTNFVRTFFDDSYYLEVELRDSIFCWTRS